MTSEWCSEEDFPHAVARAHVRGVAVDFSPALIGGRLVELPTYPTEHPPLDATGPAHAAL